MIRRRGAAFALGCAALPACQMLLDFGPSAPVTNDDAGASGATDAAPFDALVEPAADAAPAATGPRRLLQVGAGVAGFAVNGTHVAWLDGTSLHVWAKDSATAAAPIDLPCDAPSSEGPVFAGPVSQATAFVVACGLTRGWTVRYTYTPGADAAVLLIVDSAPSTFFGIAASEGHVGLLTKTTDDGVCHVYADDKLRTIVCTPRAAAAANAAAFYYVDVTGAIARADWNTSNDVELTTPPSAVVSLAANDSDVFWAGPNGVGHVSVDGMQKSNVSTGAQAIAVSGQHVVLLRDDRVLSTDPSFATATPLSSAGEAPRRIVAAPEGAYWLAGDWLWFAPY